MFRTADTESGAAGFFAGLDPWNVVFALAAVVAGIVLGIVAKRGATVLLAKVHGLTDDARHRIARAVRLTIILLGIGVAIAFLGAPIQPVIALAILVAVIAVLALRGVSENFAAGIVLQTRRALVVGDLIEVVGYTGIVREMNGRSVTIRTLDGRIVHVPNSAVLSNTFVNDTEGAGRRSELEVRIRPTADFDLAAARATMIAGCAATDGVHHREPPHALTVAVEPDRITFALRFWHHPAHGALVRSAVIDHLAQTLSAYDVAITSQRPEPPLTAPGQV